MLPSVSAERRAVSVKKRHLQTYWNMRRLRDSLYRRYCSLLMDKIHSQRLQQRERVTAPPSPSSGGKQRKHRTAFSKVQHNDLYLKDLPKTRYYQIFELQKELFQHGHLQTHHALEEFYKSFEYHSHPSKIQRSLQDVKRKMLKRPETQCGTSQPGNDAEQKEASNLRSTEEGPESAQCLLEEVFGGSLEKDEFEQMFPKMKMPMFLTSQPNFMQNFQCRLPHSASLDIPVKSRKAEMYMKQIKDMHSLCLVNMRFSQSLHLLDREVDSLCWLELQNQKIPALRQRNHGDGLHQTEAILPHVDSHKTPSKSFNLQQQTVHSNSPPSEKDKFEQVKANVQFLDPVVFDSAVRRSKAPEPLCIEDVYRQKDVEVISCGVKIWKKDTMSA